MLGRFKWIIIGMAAVCLLQNPVYAKRISIFTVSGQVSSSYEYNNNIFLTESDEVSDSIMVISPILNVSSKLAKVKLSSNYHGIYRRYAEHADEDNLMNEFSFSLQSNKDNAISVNALLSSQSSTDIRGDVNNSVQLEDLPNSFDKRTGTIGVNLNNESRTNKLESFVTLTETRYVDSFYSFRNTDTQSIRVNNKYIISGRSNVFLFVSQGITDYLESNDAVTDSRNRKYGFGGQWLVSGRINSNAEFAYETQGALDKNLVSYTGIYAKASLIWHRKEYSRYTLSFIRESSENAKGNLNNVQNSLGVSWRHEFSRRSNVNISWLNALTQIPDNSTTVFNRISSLLSYKLTNKSGSSLLVEYSKKSERLSWKSNYIVNPVVNYNATKSFTVSGGLNLSRTNSIDSKSIHSISTIFTLTYRI